MKWSELSEAQRDTLVHENVMGKSTKPCTAAQYYGDKQRIVVRCEGCGYEFPRGDLTSSNEYGPDVYPLHDKHNVPVPRYSTSMDAAWLVVRRINNPNNPAFPDYREYAQFINELTGIVGSDVFFDLFYCGHEGDHLTPARICIAALRAVGVEIEL